MEVVRDFFPMSVKVLSTSTETVVTTTYNLEYKGVKYTLADLRDEKGDLIESTLRDEKGDLIEDFEWYIGDRDFTDNMEISF
jgi:hypothetical protein